MSAKILDCPSGAYYLFPTFGRREQSFHCTLPATGHPLASSVRRAPRFRLSRQYGAAKKHFSLCSAALSSQERGRASRTCAVGLEGEFQREWSEVFGDRVHGGGGDRILQHRQHLGNAGLASVLFVFLGEETYPVRVRGWERVATVERARQVRLVALGGEPRYACVECTPCALYC